METPRPSTIIRLSNKASNWLKRRKSISNLRAVGRYEVATKRIRKRITLNCINQSPPSSPEYEIVAHDDRPTPQGPRRSKSAFPFLAPVNYEDGSSVADFSDDASSNATMVRRKTPGALAHHVVDSDWATSPSHNSTESFRALEIRGYKTPAPHPEDLEVKSFPKSFPCAKKQLLSNY